MKFKYNNVTFNFTKLSYIDILGEIEFTIPKRYFKKFIKDFEEIPYNTNEEWENLVFQKFDYIGNSPDTLIVFLNWCFNQTSKRFNINVSYSNIFWLIHDCFHAENDVSGSEVYVNNDIEEQRLIDTFEYMIKHKLELPSFIEIKEIEEAYKNRFKKPIYLSNYIFK